MSEATRLKHILNLLKLNASQFAKRTGIMQGSVSAITLGNKRITIEILHKIIATYPLISIDWLMKGVGDPFLPESQFTALKTMEDPGDYDTLKSTVGAPADGLPDEETMKSIIADNLKSTGKRWKMTQAQILDLFGASVGRGGASTYFRGDTLPRLPLLLRFERFTGWPLAVLSTRAINFEELPPAPLLDAPVEPVCISAAALAELKAELHRLRNRIGRIIDQIDNPN